MDRRPPGEMEVSHAKLLVFSLFFSPLLAREPGGFAGITWHIRTFLGNAWHL
jgi:hypothetical protein